MFASGKTSAASTGGYQISRSLRFNSADSAYLNRTPASAGNRRTFTVSAWVKRAALGTLQYLWEGGSPDGQTTRLLCRFNTDDTLRVATGSTIVFNTTQVFRDPSSWYHIVVAIDTPNGTQASRARLYVNGSEVTTFSSASYFGLNDDTGWNMAQAHSIGRSHVDSAGYLSAYTTDFYNVDGTQLTPSSFGETNAQTGVWQPKAYSGSYGTNGFYLNFSDNSNTTAATLGKDYSGNGNNWTPNNFSVTAGAGNDSLVDSPTSYGTDTGAGGTVRGNYATWNPLQTLGGTGGTVSNGNLDFSIGTSQNNVASTLFVTSGKWYCEITATTISGTSIGEITINDSNGNIAVGYRSTGTKDVDSYSTNAAYGATWAVGDTIGVAFDVDNKQVTFYKNGTSQGAITYTGSALTTNSMGVLCAWRTSATFAGTANFGQRPFAYTAPSGFQALCTQNLPTPTIGATTATQAGNYFNTALWTGDNTTNRNIAVGFEPDLVWTKGRNSASWSHFWQDRLRGFVNFIQSPSTAAETTTTPNIVSGTYSSGFTIQNNGNSNNSGSTYVAWNWKANGSGSTNTSGSITSTVSANTTSGFSVVTFTATANSGSIGHGLGVAPSMIILKSRNNTSNWVCYHASLGADKYILLESTAAAVTNTATWQNTTPTSTVFYSNGPFVTGYTEVAYCFAEVAGYSKFGSYTGNGSTDGPFVYCGFKPRWILIKASSASTYGSWRIWDTTRNPYNVMKSELYPNLSNAEDSIQIGLDATSNGFKVRSTISGVNGSAETLIFAAFAENPFKYSLAQ